MCQVDPLDSCTGVAWPDGLRGCAPLPPVFSGGGGGIKPATFFRGKDKIIIKRGGTCSSYLMCKDIELFYSATLDRCCNAQSGIEIYAALELSNSSVVVHWYERYG